MRRATVVDAAHFIPALISIHALHEESDYEVWVRAVDAPISIHALHEESDEWLPQTNSDFNISIHALHEESDEWLPQTNSDFNISIHALHEESDSTEGYGYKYATLFQSTLSMRRATGLHLVHGIEAADFNPRSP